MMYTLMKGLVWFLLALALGLIIGWLLRSVVAGRQVRRARSEGADAAEVEQLRRRVAELESAPEQAAGSQPEVSVETDASGESELIDAASVMLGRPVVRDDLTVISGIGPMTVELCHGIGIRTWADLAATEVSLLRTMLGDAGPRFKTADPTDWPRQATLLADGRWAEFEAVTDGPAG